MARKPKAEKAAVTTTTVDPNTSLTVTGVITGNPFENNPFQNLPLMDPTLLPTTEATAHPPQEGPQVADADFFSGLPEGFVPGRRADYLGDVFLKLQDFISDPEKVIWLRHNDSPALRYLIRLAFHPNVEWLIPTGLPIFKAWKGRRFSSPSELKRECRRLYLFLKGGNDNINDEKRQKLFQETIEGLESTELGVLTAIKDRTTDEDFGLTEELALLAYPGILNAPVLPKFIR